jgi:predicted nucleotidyltransferase
MKVSAIICEYNPFHNGHKHQLNCIKAQSNNPIVAIMSGNFTQRGDVAIVDKFTRAENAIKNGVDLVIELPTVYASSGAESFARGGVQITDALSCTEQLCFSAEDSNKELLIKVADAFENPEFNNEIKKNMKLGNYYPQAVAMAFESIYSKELADIVSKPNNTLGIEYIKMLKKTNIKPFIIQRIGTGHDEKQCNGNITSASNLRHMILNNGKNPDNYVPIYSGDEYEHPASIKNLEKVILYKLRTMSKTDLQMLPDVTEGLENRLYEFIRKSSNIDELLNSVKTKRYTLARLRRIVISALLGITKDMAKSDVPYIRVLAFNSKGAEVLTEIKKGQRLPLITNVADGYKSLNDRAKRIFDIDLLASDIYSLATDSIQPCGKEFTKALRTL